MILFVWSLIVSAVNYARRQRLSDVVAEYLSRDGDVRGSIMLRRVVNSGLLKVASAPSVAAESSLLYRTEGLEVMATSGVPTLNPSSWILISPTSQKDYSVLNNAVRKCNEAVFFIGSMRSGEGHKAASLLQVNLIEELSLPVAWRKGDAVLVLFTCSLQGFKEVVCHWAENILRYKNSFHVESIETVELNLEFRKLLDQKKPPENLAQREKICLSDILAAKNICDSLSSAVPPLTLDGESAQSSTLSTPVSASITDHFKMENFKFSNRLSELTVDINLEEEKAEVSRDELSPLRERLTVKAKSVRQRPRRYSMFSSTENSEEGAVQHNRERRRSLSPVSMMDLGFPTASDAITSWGIRRMSSIRASGSRPMSRRTSQQSANLATASNSPAKPPNVLVYSGGKDCSRLVSLVERCLPVDSYAVYSVSLDHLVKAPWEETAASILVLDTDTLSDEGWTRLEEYFRKGGRCLFLCQNKLLASLTDCNSARKRSSLLKLAFSTKITGNTALGKDFEQFMKRVTRQLKNPKIFEQFHAKDLVGGHSYTISVIREEGTPLVFYVKNTRRSAGALFTDSTLEAILEEESTVVYQALEQLGMPVAEFRNQTQLTPGYLLTHPRDGLSSSGWLNEGRLEGTVRITFCRTPRDELVSEVALPVVVCGNLHHLFDSKNYFANLTSSTYGRTVLFVPVAGSTMDIAQTLLGANSIECDRLVVIARHQNSGKGRGGNRWLSPAGCAMFSFPFKVPVRSKLGRSPGFIQHLIALAVVDGINRLVKLEGFALSLKWPNDIYFSRSHKLGGVLVNCAVQGNELRCVIGCGLNVSNSKPTVCLNDLLPSDVPRLSVERVIAVGISRFEELVNTFQIDGFDRILPLYYQYWLHGREEVLLEDRNERVQIRGLDAHGYLEVRSKQSGHVFSVQPDGNTFDMMRNLIRLKD